MRAYGKLIRSLTDPANFENFRYMPVTRDLTRGQRTLLYNVFGFGTTTLAVEGAERGETQIDHQALSRSMRVAPEH